MRACVCVCVGVQAWCAKRRIARERWQGVFKARACSPNTTTSEQKVISAVRVASQVMEELSKTSQIDRARLADLAAAFMQHVQVWVRERGG